MARALLRALSSALALIVLASCAARPARPDDDGRATRPVYVVSDGWHTAIVLAREHISSALWPEHSDLAGSYLEVGWGDKNAYLADRLTLRLALGAAFTSAASALHVAGFDAVPVERFRDLDVLEIRAAPRAFDELVWLIGASYARDGGGNVVKLGRGYAVNSMFYLATGRYHALNTCNSWTAKALQAAGCSMVPTLALTAMQLMQQASTRCGVVRPLPTSPEGRAALAESPEES